MLKFIRKKVECKFVCEQLGLNKTLNTNNWMSGVGGMSKIFRGEHPLCEGSTIGTIEAVRYKGNYIFL